MLQVASQNQQLYLKQQFLEFAFLVHWGTQPPANVYKETISFENNIFQSFPCSVSCLKQQTWEVTAVFAIT